MVFAVDRRVAIACLLVALGACGASRSTDGGPAPVGGTGSCVVTLHGKGGHGAAPVTTGGRTIVSPDGNAAGWGGRQWQYDDAASYAAALMLVEGAVERAACTSVVVHGFSNGGAFAGKLYCQGETLAGRLRGVVVDDPVPDGGVRPCAPGTGVRVALYWTGALAGTAVPGWSCGEKDWTCAGGTTIGIDAYAAALNTAVQPSPHRDHVAYDDAPELALWSG